MNSIFRPQMKEIWAPIRETHGRPPQRENYFCTARLGVEPVNHNVTTLVSYWRWDASRGGTTRTGGLKNQGNSSHIISISGTGSRQKERQKSKATESRNDELRPIQPRPYITIQHSLEHICGIVLIKNHSNIEGQRQTGIFLTGFNKTLF